ncbi:NADPH azoreductase-like [Anneissia japonica]|uniref:NADPH azoreductase-like n=1 Tax=Anneissia japonica TaxID=1529436 RepID=UPI0014254C22|nr:NADPH azoreductase-like [Anneissia japonica]
MAATKPLKIVLFLGTVRENRLGLRVAKFMQNYLVKTGHDVDFMDAQELDLPLLKKPLHFYRDQSEAPPLLVDLGQRVKTADGYVMVSGEYNHSIPPALSNLLDYFPGSSFSYKPSAIVCYSPGQYGGMRAAIQLRALLGEIGCLSVSNIFGIPQANKSLDEEGNPQNDHMESGAKRLITQLDWHAHAMRNHRESVGIPK